MYIKKIPDVFKIAKRPKVCCYNAYFSVFVYTLNSYKRKLFCFILKYFIVSLSIFDRENQFVSTDFP